MDLLQVTGNTTITKFEHDRGNSDSIHLNRYIHRPLIIYFVTPFLTLCWFVVIRKETTDFFIKWTHLSRRLRGDPLDTVDVSFARFAAEHNHPILTAFLMGDNFTTTSVKDFTQFLSGQSDHVDDSKGTLAHLAAQHGHGDLLQLMVHKGANPEEIDDEHRSVIDIAKVSKSKDVYLVLQGFPKDQNFAKQYSACN